jgi:hypothetical protein
MHYRGKLKKRMRSTTLELNTGSRLSPGRCPPQPGSDDNLGTIVDVLQQNNNCVVLHITPITEAE